MTIVLIHGLGSDGQYMLDTFGPALPADAAVVAPDVRAHGASTLIGGAADFAFDALAREVAADARAATGDSMTDCTIIGVSMGAALALRIALDGLLPVRRALFVRPSFTDQPLPPNLRAFPVIGRLLRESGPAKGAELFRTTALYREVLAESPLGAAGLLAQFRYPQAAARAIRLIEVPRNRAFAAASDLGGVGVPTSVIGAPRDPVHPFGIAERWAEGLAAPLTRLPARDDGPPAQLAALRAATAAFLAAG